MSPVFQQAAFDALRLAYRYEAWDTPSAALAQVVQSLRGGARVGANVTVPHKARVAQYVDRVSDEVRATGAVNTIVREPDGTLSGHNTDVQGFADALRADGGVAVAGARVVVLGAGGAARAVVYALLRNGATHVTLVNRSRSRADAFVADFGDARLVAIRAEPLPPCDLIVNCTTVGMAHSSTAGISPLAAEQIPPGITVVDIVANPLVTPLMRDAQARGCRVLGGLPMLVRQGAAAFTLWTGQPAPLSVMISAAQTAMVRTS